MPDKQEGHPNLNRGGNDGNAYGAGPHRKSFRAKAAKAAEEGLDFFIKVSRGNKSIPVPDAPKGKDVRPPTLKERREAYDLLLRYGIGTQDEVLMVADEAWFEALAKVLPRHVPDEAAQLALLSDLRAEVAGEAG